jgi:hypothetical protein
MNINIKKILRSFLAPLVFFREKTPPGPLFHALEGFTFIKIFEFQDDPMERPL